MSFRKRLHFCWHTSFSLGTPSNNTTHFCTANLRLEIFQGKIEGHTHLFTCRQIVADREARSALDLDLTFVRIDDLLRGSRHAEQLLAESMGRECGGVTQGPKSNYGHTCLGLADLCPMRSCSVEIHCESYLSFIRQKGRLYIHKQSYMLC